MSTFLVANAVLARRLSQGEMGLYLLAFSIVFVCAALARLGLQQVVVRFIGQALMEGNEIGARSAVIRTTSLAAVTAAAVAALLISPVGAAFLGAYSFPTSLRFRVAFGLWLFFEAIRLVGSESLRGYNDIPAATVLGDAGRNLIFLVAVILPLWTPSLEHAVFLSAATGGLLVLLLGVTLAIRLHVVTGDGEPTRYRAVAVVAIPLMVASLGLIAISQLDVWIVGAFLGSKEVALYGVANRVAGLLTVPLFVVNAVALPIVARFSRSGQTAEMTNVLRGGVAIAAIPMVIGFLLFVAFGSQLLSFAFGDAYSAAKWPLVALSAGQVANVVTGLCGITLIMFGFERWVMVASLVSSALMIGLCIGAAQLGSTTLVGVACAVSVTVQNVSLMFLCRWKVGIWTFADIRPAALRSINRSAASVLARG